MTVANKIIYGNNTLIDLTGDTATAANVLSGKTFHLASGVKKTGTLVLPTMKKSTSSVSANYSDTLVFRQVTSEPSWFIVVGTYVYSSSTFYNNPVVYFLYDGTTTSIMYITAKSTSTVQRTIKSKSTGGTYPYFSYDGSLSQLIVRVASSASQSNPNFQSTRDTYTLFYL